MGYSVLLQLLCVIISYSAYPASTLSRATIGLSAKRHWNGVLLTGRRLLALILCLLRINHLPETQEHSHLLAYAYII